MGASNYDPCLKQILKYEGGYTNHPSDPGGPTNWGITIHDARMYWKKDATAEDVRRMPLSVAKEIYRARYWNKVDGDNLPDGVDLAVFDYGVNSGIGRALPCYARHKDKAPIPAIKAMCAERLHFLKALRTWSVFGAGWGSRVTNVEATGVKMWLMFENRTKSMIEQKKTVEEHLQKEATSAGNTAKGQITAGTAAGATTGGAVVNTPSIIQWDWVTAGLGVFLVAATIFVGYRIYVNLQRKKAYLDAAATA